MVLSVTAPRFTDAEDEREVAELSQEEKDAILADALGLSAETENDQDISPELIDRFHNQMDQIPLEQKTIYTRAKEQCPLVVAAESDPERFLRSRNYDPKAAASLMAIYWEKRYEFFEESFSALPKRLLVDASARKCLFVDKVIELFGNL